MSAIQNITVKKADGATDVTYTAIAGSAGDKSPAIWKNQSVGTTPAEHPTFTVVAQSNGPGTSRRVKFSGMWPTVRQDSGGNKIVSGRASGEGSFLLPQNMTQADLNEVVHQFTNLLVSSLVRGDMAVGVAPR